MKQVTLAGSFSVSGKGLHTGKMINATFKPAPENHGYKLQRIDLEGAPVLAALAENVVQTTRGTVIANGDVTVSTIEHAMAALYAAGIDNVLIELDGPEMPILDGSARVFVDKIKETGLLEQNDDKKFYVIKRKTEIKDEETGASIIVLPDDDFRVEVKVEFDSPVIPNQYASLEKLSDFDSEIASSRTFVFVREIEPLIKGNLIKGGDLENAIVIYDLMDNMRIRELLPHRYPFQLVDKIIEKGINYIVGVKNITANEPFFPGHFPQEPVLPGVLQIEAMAQTGGLLVLSQVEDPERYSTYFMKIDNVKFRQKVVPGDTLIFHISFMTPLRRGCAVMKGYAFVGDKIVTECEFMAQIIKNK